MATEMFLKIDKIPGESTDEGHQDWIEIESWSFSANQPNAGARSTGGAASAGLVQFSDVIVAKSVDKSSPGILNACTNATHFGEVRIEVCRASGKKEKYYEIVMTDVMIANYSNAQSTGGIPNETVTFNPGTIQWIYTEMDHGTGAPKGPIQHKWSMITNSGG